MAASPARVSKHTLWLVALCCGVGVLNPAMAQTETEAETVTTLDEVVVQGESESDEFIHAPFLPPVEGTRINAGKKTSVTDLDALPKITNNNYRQALALTPGVDVGGTITKLQLLPGIGEWTAQYIAMRALAWPDAFPHTDLGVMRALRETEARRVLAAGEAWRPWRSYAVMHLWTQGGSDEAVR